MNNTRGTVKNVNKFKCLGEYITRRNRYRGVIKDMVKRLRSAHVAREDACNKKN